MYKPSVHSQIMKHTDVLASAIHGVISSESLNAVSIFEPFGELLTEHNSSCPLACLKEQTSSVRFKCHLKPFSFLPPPPPPLFFFFFFFFFQEPSKNKELIIQN